MKKFIIVILMIASICFARKGFTPEYFIKKHNLSLPLITDEMLDVSKHTEIQQIFKYIYSGKSDKIDSIYNFIYRDSKLVTIDYQDYTHQNDTIFIKSIAIRQESGDTCTYLNEIYTNNGENILYVDFIDKCSTYVACTNWGERIKEVTKCPEDKDFRGSIFPMIEHSGYLESMRKKNGILDSNDIRRYYFTPYDSCVAIYGAGSEKKFKLYSLNLFNKQHKRIYEYHFDFRSKKEGVIRDCTVYRYNEKGMLTDEYVLDRKNRKSKELELLGYDKREYDSLGRLIKTTTWFKPIEYPE